MKEICIKCGRDDENGNSNIKFNSIGIFTICRECSRPYFNKCDEVQEFCGKFYYELKQIALDHPERLNPEDTSNSVCDSLNNMETC